MRSARNRSLPNTVLLGSEWRLAAEAADDLVGASDPEVAVRAARYLTYIVGRAHGRQMDEAARASWRLEVLRGTDGGDKAPTWLWSGVVELAGRHEAGYLQHCHRMRTRKPPETGLAAY